MPEKKKVLFIAYLFPPVGGSGVQRSSKFVKYLPDFGWHPLVLTVKEPYDFYSDESLLSDVKDKCTIYRTFSIEPMKWVRKFLKRKWQKKITSEDKKEKTTLKPGFLVKLKTYLLFPDNEILWLPFAVFKGMSVIRKEKPSIIFSTASPFTDHLIALILAKLYKLPWAADFRDLWVDRPNFPKNKFRLFIDRKLEKLVIENADCSVTATSLIADRFNELYPGEKYITITNGYDEDDFNLLSEYKPEQSYFRITYTGIFNKEQNPQKVFSAFKKMIDHYPDVKEKIKLRFVGQLDNPGDLENITYFKKSGLDKYSELIPYKPHNEVIKEMKEAIVLLLFVGEYPHNEGILTGKIFEYLYSGRPILAVVPPWGLAAEVIKNTNTGIIAANDNEEEIIKCTLQLFNLYNKNELENAFKRKNIEHYSRRNLTKDLTDVFEKVINKESIAATLPK